MAEIPKKDWKQVVESSGGRSFFVPEKYVPAVKAWDNLRKELRALTEKASEIEVHTSVSLQNLMLDLRKHAVETGMDSPWTSDIGFDTQALDEGVYIINLVENLK